LNETEGIIKNYQDYGVYDEFTNETGFIDLKLFEILKTEDYAKLVEKYLEKNTNVTIKVSSELLKFYNYSQFLFKNY